MASVHHVRFLLCCRLMIDRPTLLTCKGSCLLMTVNEKKHLMANNTEQ